MPDHPILAIDHGQARIGLAATDELGIASHPVETIHTRRVDPLPRIAQIVEERRIRLILLGLPLRLDGREGEAAHRVRAFGTELAGKIPAIPIQYSDERLTTTSAAGKLREAGKPARAQKDLIDQVAALEILNDWLAENECP
ncbi:MAG: Holliday junction resolvase RuvX [Verrucomicrobiota bacterium]|nr:Holliday junction resolvase RuvX [Verrucomicrobiota bacterium]